MAWKLQPVETNGLEVFAIRARYIGLRSASNDSSWKSSDLWQERSRRDISRFISGREYFRLTDQA